MIEQAFEVATEFKFDVGQAILNTDTLKASVDDLSKAAGGALSSLQYLAGGLVAHLGFGSGGLLSILTKAVQTSEEFNNSALTFANNIMSNITVLSGTINTFNDRLDTSGMLMRNIADAASDVGVSTEDLARVSQILATPLAMRGKLGTNYQGAINMGKNLLIGGQAAGLHPQAATESLYRALTDNMPLHGALFARLVNTQAFKGAKVTTQHQIMGMQTDKKIDLLNKALEQLGGDADFIANRLNQLGVQFTILKNQVAVLLKPIGDAIAKPIRQILQGINSYLRSHGKQLGESIGKLLGNILSDPKALFVNLMQLKNLGKDFKRSLHLTELYATLVFINRILQFFGVTLFRGGLMRMMGKGAWSALAFVFANVGVIARVAWSALKLIGRGIMEFVPALLGFLYISQILSRARAIAKVKDFEAWVTLTPRIAALLAKLKTAFEKIMLPINMSIDFWAKLLAPLFTSTFWLKLLLPLLEQFVSLLDMLGTAVVYATAGISGLIYMLIGFVDDIMHLKNPFSSALENLKTGFTDFLSAHPFNDMSKATVNQVTNVGKIEARFDMREQLEPDRIAFAVTDHLKKLAMNPTQGRGQSLSSAFAGNQGFAGAR